MAKYATFAELRCNKKYFVIDPGTYLDNVKYTWFNKFK